MSRGLIVSGASFIVIGVASVLLVPHPGKGRLALAALLLVAGVAEMVVGAVLERRRRTS